MHLAFRTIKSDETHLTRRRSTKMHQAPSSLLNREHMCHRHGFGPADLDICQHDGKLFQKWVMLSFDLGLVCPTSHDMTCHVQHVQPITLDVRGESRTALVQQSERLTGRGLAGQAPSPGRWRTANSSGRAVKR